MALVEVEEAVEARMKNSTWVSSTRSSDFIVGAGGPGGVRLPWAKTFENPGFKTGSSSAAPSKDRRCVFMGALRDVLTPAAPAHDVVNGPRIFDV